MKNARGETAMNEEAAFIAALVAEPSDRTAALVFADWLDERGDPRGPMLRNDEVRAWMPPKYENPIPTLRAALESGQADYRGQPASSPSSVTHAMPELMSLLSHTSTARANACGKNPSTDGAESEGRVARTPGDGERHRLLRSPRGQRTP